MKTKLIKAIFNQVILTIGLFALVTICYGSPQVSIMLEGRNDLKFTVKDLVILAPAPLESEIGVTTYDQGKLKVWTPLTPLSQAGKAPIVTSPNHSRSKPQNGFLDIQFSLDGKNVVKRINLLDQNSQQTFEDIGVTAQVQKSGSGADTEYRVTIK